MADKKIEDYLHLYLGCECRLFWRKANGELEYERNGILITVQPENIHQYGLVFKCETAHGNFVEYAYTYADVKPLLRKLSDMSQEEWNAIEEKYILPDAYGYNGLRDEFLIGTTKYRFHWSFVNSALIDLRKLGIDVDGLIDAGIALDKTKI